jgi:hypothetical protein
VRVDPSRELTPAPFALEPSPCQHASRGWIKEALFDLEHFARPLFDRFSDLESVELAFRSN